MAFALVDCESFYASCERIFRPDLKNVPIVVLSNNDGCVIARSTEAKRMGIAMGVPWFKVRELFLKKNGQVFSSNFTLITVKKVPQGQAKTCLLASKYLRDDDRIFVHSCDNLINFNHQILISSLKKFNGVIITTKPNKSHINNISMYGWVNIKNRIIKKTS